MRLSMPRKRNVHPHPSGTRSQQGFTLVELMIALVLGLMVTASVLGVYINSSRNFSQDEQYARMQENGRYALRILVDDLSMTDFWGQVISTDALGTSLTVPVGDCGVAVGLFDAAAALLYVNAHATSPVSHFALCSAVDSVRLAGTDVIVIKRVAGRPTASTFVDAADTDGDGNTSETITTGAGALQDEVVYLRANSESGSFIDDATSSNLPTVGWADWRYVPRLYFIRDHHRTPGDGVPALCRVDLDETSLDEISCIAEGVEDMHLEFGIDTDADGVANLYKTDPSTAEMESAAAVRIHLLLRTARQDAFHTSTKSFVLGDEIIAAATDGYLRTVYSTTIALRNSISRSLFN